MNDKYNDIVTYGFKNNKGESEIMHDLFEAGVAFDDLKKVFNNIAEALGYKLSAKARKQKIKEMLTDWRPLTSEEVADMVIRLAEVLGTDKPKARRIISNWEKTNGVKFPKMPRKPKTQKVGFSGHYELILNYALENKNCTKEDLIKFAVDHEIPASYGAAASNMVVFAKKWCKS